VNVRPEVTKAFAMVLQKHRNQSKLSQERLSLAAGLERTFVYRVEQGKRNPSLESIFRLAEALGIAPEQLVKETREHVSLFLE
jgi:transcriptional regulator with XRE-family HTH domain